MVRRDEATDNSMTHFSVIDSWSSAFSTIFQCLRPKFISLALRFSRK